MTRPNIGITTQTLEAVEDQIPRSWIMRQRYVEVLTASGAVPWLVPLEQDRETLRLIYERLDGLFLPGGIDMQPSTYGEQPDPLLQRVDPARDETELQLARWAIEDRLPVLGVCRGAQLINVAAGGTLWQDVSYRPDSIKHDYAPLGGQYSREYLAHDVTVDADSRLGRIVRVDRMPVNSMHHQAIRELGTGLIASSFAPDGVIESVEPTSEQWMIGVQWHPESLVDQDARMRALYDAFIAAAAEYASERAVSGGAR
jgi:putative glutamine amidotransferase